MGLVNLYGKYGITVSVGFNSINKSIPWHYVVPISNPTDPIFGRLQIKTTLMCPSLCFILLPHYIMVLVHVWYFGPGKRNTGDWCFGDGFITFRDITELYMRGKILSVTCDCSYGGSWVKSCAKFLNSDGVQPCAHSAKAKNIFISMKASCKDIEVPYSLLFSTRANITDKNTGVLGIQGDEWEVNQGQHMRILTTTVTVIRCENKSIDASCTLEPDTPAERIFLVRGNDKGRAAWHYAQRGDCV